MFLQFEPCESRAFIYFLSVVCNVYSHMYVFCTTNSDLLVHKLPKGESFIVPIPDKKSNPLSGVLVK